VSTACAAHSQQHCRPGVAAAAAAAALHTEAIAAVLEACKEGAKVVDLCKLGDDIILA
jgi:methionine aminopeptidase